MVEVEIVKAGHTHAGKAVEIGQKITVTERQAGWLVGMKVARNVEQATEEKEIAE